MQTHLLGANANPQQLIWLALHQCYSSQPTALPPSLDETKAGLSVVEHLLAGNRGHYSPLEVANLTLNLTYLPHSLLQQLTRHRHLSFSVQSFRYTSQQFLKYAATHRFPNAEALEQLVYFGREPVKSKPFAATDYTLAHQAIRLYAYKVGKLEVLAEDARGRLPFDLRQHAVVSGNLRAWWHVLDLRLKPDTQPEFQQLALQVQAVLRLWVPQLQEWYDSRRATRAVLSP